jgi:hypothetical protein
MGGKYAGRGTDTIETIRTMLVSAIYRQFFSCFGLFDIAR